jgi:hypothetical protein
MELIWVLRATFWSLFVLSAGFTLGQVAPWWTPVAIIGGMLVTATALAWQLAGRKV